jgi:hypothetical protein
MKRGKGKSAWIENDDSYLIAGMKARYVEFGNTMRVK